MEDSGYTMPFELKTLRDTVRRFIREEVAPAEEGTDPEATHLPPDRLARLQKLAREAGLWYLATPSEHGGGGLSIFAQALVAEEASQHRQGAYNPACGAFGFDPPNVVFGGTPAQIARYVAPQIANGQKAFFAISEPSGGSDPAGAIQTRAVRRGEGWVLNGAKFWISGVKVSAYGIVFARTDNSTDPHKNVTAFFIDKDTPGFTWKETPVIRPYYPAELTFTDCYLPDSQRLGEVGQGFPLVDKLLVKGRIPYAASVIGTGTAALRLAVDYANRRETFGKPLATRQAVQWMIADSEIELKSARWLVWEAAWKADRGLDYRVEASMAKVAATETAGRVVDRVIQIFGGIGVSKELPLERWYREMRVKRIGEGPSEIHRMVVSRSILRGYRDVGAGIADWT